LRFSLAKLLILVAFAAIVLAAIVGYRNYYQSHRTGVTATIANRMMWPGYKLPESATNITYHADFGGCEAEFAISESEFLEWCNSRGWAPNKITGTIQYFKPVLLPDNDKVVTNGYTFDIPDGEGVFDADRSRTAFWASTFP